MNTERRRQYDQKRVASDPDYRLHLTQLVRAHRAKHRFESMLSSYVSEDLGEDLDPEIVENRDELSLMILQLTPELTRKEIAELTTTAKRLNELTMKKSNKTISEIMSMRRRPKTINIGLIYTAYVICKQASSDGGQVFSMRPGRFKSVLLYKYSINGQTVTEASRDILEVLGFSDYDSLGHCIFVTQ